MLLQQSIEHVSIVYTLHIHNALVHIIYSGVSGHYSHTITLNTSTAICYVR